MTMDTKALLAEAEALKPQLLTDRRTLHRDPEVGPSLPHTAAYVTERLTALGYTPRPLAGGVVADITGEDTGRCVLLRADMDAFLLENTGLTLAQTNQVDLDALLEGYDWLHLSGITPALAPNCRSLILDMLKVAKKKGLTVSFDGNFRSTLWTWEEARDFCTECLPYVDVLLGIEPYHLWKDENDHSKGDWKDGVPLQPSYEQQDEIFQRFIERYPNLKCIARHVRYAHSGSENSLKAFMWYEGHTFESKLYTFNILDRVGGGDAFASGLIYAMLHNYKAMDMINFAVASSAIKHTIHGDANITDDVSTIRNLMNMNYDIKR